MHSRSFLERFDADFKRTSYYVFNENKAQIRHTQQGNVQWKFWIFKKRHIVYLFLT